ncbi:MAG: hypothetical protein ACKOF3_12690 [Spartobacteria bacterium]
MMIKKNLIVATLGLALNGVIVGAADIPTAESAFKDAQAAENKAKKAIGDFSRTAKEPAELVALQPRAIEVEAEIKALQNSREEKCKGDPAWTINAAEIKKAKAALADLKKD